MFTIDVVRKQWENLTHKTFAHKCELPFEENVVSYSIASGACVKWRRRLWKWVTVNAENPDCRKLFKSTAQIEIEIRHHYINHPHMIHPFSCGRFFWEKLMIPVYLLLFLLIPPILANVETPLVILLMKFVLDAISYVDVVLYFFTGYYDKRKQRVVMDSKKVVKRYVCSYFLADVISSLPISICLYIIDGTTHHPLLGLMLLKLVRLPTFWRYVYKMVEAKYTMTPYIKFIHYASTIVFLLVYMVLCLVPGAELYGAMEMRGWSYLVYTVFLTARYILKVGISEAANMYILMMCYRICLIVIGAVVYVVTFAKVMQLFQSRSSSHKKSNARIEEISEYLKYKEVPARVKERVLKFARLKTQKHVVRDEEILNTLSSVLKQEILVQTCQHMVEKVAFFKDLPTPVLARIVAKLKSEFFLTNDVVIMAGQVGNAMYFIYFGSVAVYTKDGREICHLEDGNHFGEIALVINEPRVATVVAIGDCEMFRLNRRDFQEAIEPFPELNKKIRVVALSRLQTTLQMMDGLSNKRSSPTTSASGFSV